MITPNRFDGEPNYTPHFYKKSLEGRYDDKVGASVFFHVDDDDRRIFPELDHVEFLELWLDDDECIHTETVTWDAT